jgi:Holliday junction resolvase RusA-like endonuclease
MKVTFQVLPVPASRPRVTRWSTYFPKKYTSFKADMNIALKDIHFIPTKELLYVKVDFYVAIPKSWSKKKTIASDGKVCDNNADIDNYCKAILDSLEGVYYENDKQIAMIRARKYYSTNPRIKYEQIEINKDGDKL